VVTYDDNGAYGHPDHIQAHRVTAAAFASVQSEPWAPRKLYWTAIPKSRLQAMMDFAKQAGLPEFFEGAETVDDLPLGTPDELVTTEIDGTAYVDRKMAAMRAHRSQIADDSPFFSFPPEMLPMVWGYEHFTLAEGPRGPGAGEEGWEPDLFAGL
jgi:N-acetyl-1-D-myo-inositol-2-amino-2-deoxy-alpha-D-glucopyranoside deacetylase